MRRALLTVALLATACDPCHGWDAVKIKDRADMDDGETVDIVQSAIDTLAGWSGRDETCVGKVRVVDDLKVRGKKALGVYIPQTGNIRVKYTEDEWRLADTIIHEFCHAIDDEEGHPSLDWVEALEPYAAALNSERYATDEARTKEAFANICAEGPVLFPMWRQLEEACGEDVVDEAYQLVHELLYSSFDAEAELGRFDSAVEEWEIEGLDDHEAARMDWFYGAPMVAGGAGLVGLELLVTLDDDGIEEAWQPVLRLIDPHGPTELDSLALGPLEELIARDHNNNPYYQSHELIGSTADPLIYDRTQPGTAWRVRAEPLTLEALDFPQLPEEAIIRGFEHAGSMLAWVRTAEDDFIATASLKDSGWTALSFDDDVRFEDASIFAFEADVDGATVLLSGPSGLTAAGLSFKGELLWHQALGCADCRAYHVSRLPDGGVLVPAWVSTSGDTNSLFPIHLDPSDGSLRVPNGDCERARYVLDGVTWDGGRWMLWLPEQEDGSRGPLQLLELFVDVE
jgi:hypothetical protein